LRDALTVLDEQSVDVVITDLQLPDSVGVATLQRLVENAGSLPIIALTGYDDPTLGARLLEEGAHCYWSKDRISDRALPNAIIETIHQTSRRL
jgi:DNA-binding NarL/FixJ family response regulator